MNLTRTQAMCQARAAADEVGHYLSAAIAHYRVDSGRCDEAHADAVEQYKRLGMMLDIAAPERKRPLARADQEIA